MEKCLHFRLCERVRSKSGLALATDIAFIFCSARHLLEVECRQPLEKRAAGSAVKEGLSSGSGTKISIR